MTMRTALALPFLCTALAAQTLTTTELVLGNEVAFDVTNATPFAVALLALSTTGVGAGTCFPQPFNFCFDVLEPVTIVATLPIDAQGNASLSFVIPFGIPQVLVHAQALVVAINPNLVITKTNTRSEPIVPIDALSDSFDGSSLAARWTRHNPSVASIAVGGGQLTLQTLVGGPPVCWYANGEGFLAWKRVTGDFTCTATVSADDPTNPGQPPFPNFMLGGLTVRNPSAPSGQHNCCTSRSAVARRRT